jgi:hypothetical protein
MPPPRVRSTLFLQSSDDEPVCSVCGEDTIEVIMCCKKPLCSTCLGKWVAEATTCPFCNCQLHAGEDRRHLNDNIGAGNEATVSSHVLFRLIRTRLEHKLDTIRQVIDRINGYLDQDEQQYPTEQPIRIPIRTPDPAEPFYTYYFNFPDDSGVTMSEGNRTQQQNSSPPMTHEPATPQHMSPGVHESSIKFVLEFQLQIPRTLPLIVCSALIGLFFYLMNKVLVS